MQTNTQAHSLTADVSLLLKYNSSINFTTSLSTWSALPYTPHVPQRIKHQIKIVQHFKYGYYQFQVLSNIQS
jgi:hypothetical protein